VATHRQDAESRIKELFVYVLARSGDDSSSLTRTKVAKILWYSDFGAYRDLGEPITGWPYIKGEHGPMPDRMMLLELDLEAEGRLEIRREGNVTRYLLKGEPALGVFSEAERDYVDKVLYLYRSAWASYLSHRAHEDSIGWQAAKRREEIPYETALLSTDELTEREIERGQELAREFGWT
jgi:hypothetical protein